MTGRRFAIHFPEKFLRPLIYSAASNFRSEKSFVHPRPDSLVVTHTYADARIRMAFIQIPVHRSTVRRLQAKWLMHPA
jgi:hypothetical protein